MSELNEDIFKAIDHDSGGTTAEEVVGRLREMIHRGELKSGDRLPPERDLARQLGVSRPTLRAGIRTLSAVGVLKSKQGAGTFVVEADASPALDSNPLRLLASLHGFSSAEMFEARLLLEMAIAGLAAERATSEDLRHLPKNWRKCLQRSMNRKNISFTICVFIRPSPPHPATGSSRH